MKKILIFIPFILFANVLSPLEEKLLDKDTQKAVVSGNKLKNSWINPITLQYKYNQTNQTPTLQKSNSFIISINQPIFKSGAIFESIKYANALKQENILQVKLKKAQLIKQAYEILFNIKKVQIAIQKQKYLLKNADLDIKRKKEQFLSGVIDSSFLDNAIINKNNLLLALEDLKNQKYTLIQNFKTLSDIDYKKVKLPKFRLISKEEYLQNINIKIAKKDIDVKKSLKYMNIGNSLLSINLIANYNDITTKYNEQSTLYSNSSDSFYNIGFSITMPLDINVFKTIQESKIDYLKSVLNYQQQLKQANSEYNSKIKELQIIDKKIKIYNNSIKMYKSLIKSTKDNIKAGVNTILDLENLENSLNIAKLNKQNLIIEKDLKLLELYYLRGFK